MSVLAAFLSHEVTTQFRSARFRILALAYVSMACIPPVALYVGSRHDGYLLEAGSYASMLRAIQPALTALLASVLAVDAITREREEGSFAVVSLAPMTASGYVFRRWLAVLAIALPVTAVPSVLAAVLAAQGERRIPDLAPLAWEWLLHVAPPLVVMSGLMLALGTITGRTILAIIAFGAAMTFGLGFLQDALAYAHRKVDGPGAMIGFDPLVLGRLVWMLRGWWEFEPPTAAGYPIEQELDRLLPESALIVACTILFLGFAPAFLRRTRADVKPWRIRADHPLRTMLRGVNRVRENYRPDAGLQPADRAVMVLSVVAAGACLAFLLHRETRYTRLANERYAAEQAGEPKETSLSLAARTIRIEGAIGRPMQTRTTFEIVNQGQRSEGHLAFGLHSGLEVQRVAANCGRTRVTRKWDRLGLDLDVPIPPGGVCQVSIDVAGQADAVVFNLNGRARFGQRYRHWERAEDPVDLSDLSRSTFTPAATGQRLLLSATDFAPVPRYTPWTVDTEPIDPDRDTTSFVGEGVATPADLRVSLRLPEGFTAVDSCGSVSTKTIESRCVVAMPEFQITAARFATVPLGRGRLVHLERHRHLAQLHLPALSEALMLAEGAWPGLRISASPVFVERPINGEGRQSYYRGGLVEATGSMFAIPEWMFTRRKPLEAARIGAAIIRGTLTSRRRVPAEERPFFAAFFGEVARVRIGASETRSATIGGKGPRPTTDPLMRIATTSGMRLGPGGNDRLRGVLADLEYRVGADRVVEGVNEFVAGSGTGTAKELLDAIGRRANVSLDNMYRDYFVGTALPKLTFEDATFTRDGGRWVARGYVHNLATGEAFVPLVLRTQFGSARQTVRVGPNERVPFILSTDYEPRTLQLDPERVVYRHAAIGTIDSIDFEGES